MEKQNVNFDMCKLLLESYISENSKAYPMQIGDGMDTQQKNEMTLYLVSYFELSYFFKLFLPSSFLENNV